MSLEGIGMAAKELPACPVETTLTLISDKWKVLTAQLRQMEAGGLLIRTLRFRLGWNTR
jgi:DNA-binding HxlR family transcriptional regulator